MFGEGVITWLCGILMQYINVNMYFYFTFLVLIIIAFTMKIILSTLESLAIEKTDKLSK